MTEQQQALKNTIEAQKNVLSEINEMSNIINTKKEFALKLQGVIEYLTSTGVSLDEVTSDAPETSNIEIEQWLQQLNDLLLRI